MFFITKHIRGAEKFLETKEKLDTDLSQFTLWDISGLTLKAELSDFFQKEKKSTNHVIYEEAISRGFRAPKTNEILKELETSGDIKVTADFNRKGNFYLPSNGTNGDKIIDVTWTGKTNEQN